MRPISALAMGSLLLIGGCKQFYTIDEACKDKVPGEKNVDPTLGGEAVDALQRANCYRRLVGVKQARFQKDIQASTENHANYMAVNKVWEPGSGYLLAAEDPDKQGFTGANVYERLEYTGYNLADGHQLGYQQLLYLVDPTTGPDRVDSTMEDPHFREFILQLALVGVGMAESVIPDSEEQFGVPMRAGYYLFVHDWPAIEHSSRPVVYPKKDQIDVPTAYYTCDSRVSFPKGEWLGYPITVMVGARNTTGAFGAGGNPYNLSLKGVSVVGPKGNVDVQVQVPPAPDPTLGLQYSAIIMPLEPFEPNATYTVKAEVYWDGIDERVDYSFTTSKTETTLDPINCGGYGGTVRQGPMLISQGVIDPVDGVLRPF